MDKVVFASSTWADAEVTKAVSTEQTETKEQE